MASSSQQAQISEIIDAARAEAAAEDVNEGSDGESSSEDEQREAGAAAPEDQPSTSSAQKKKKKKKKSKAAKVLNALKGKSDIPQELVDHVLERVKEEHGPGAMGADEESVRAALEQLKIMDVVKGKAGLAGRGKKDLGEHKVNKSQTVAQHESQE
jgi:glycylpeptide N-tetradecanoyltransferase